MGLREKYDYAIQTAKGFHMEGSADERDGKLHFHGTVATQEEANKIYAPELVARQDAIKRDTVAEAVAKYWAWFRRPRGHEVAVKKALLGQQGMALN